VRGGGGTVMHKAGNIGRVLHNVMVLGSGGADMSSHEDVLSVCMP